MTRKEVPLDALFITNYYMYIRTRASNFICSNTALFIRFILIDFRLPHMTKTKSLPYTTTVDRYTLCPRQFLLESLL